MSIMSYLFLLLSIFERIKIIFLLIVINRYIKTKSKNYILKKTIFDDKFYVWFYNSIKLKYLPQF